MDFDDTPENATYRARVRAWIEEHADEAPGELAGGTDDALRDEVAALKQWQARLAAAGLAGLTWPVEWGGQGLGPVEHVIVDQELARAGVPGIFDAFGLEIFGPTLLAHGSPAQQARYLAPALHAEETWSQLFSEPGAGSDLAAVQTRAKRRDDGTWIVNGQKVWTSYAQFSAFGLMLARTDPDVPKHRGLTMFIVPFDARGVTVRGLRQITGQSEFNEVFLDDVELTDDDVVGDVGNGWRVALTTLMFERLSAASGGKALAYRPERFAAALVADGAAAHDTGIRKELGEIVCDLLAVRFSGYRTLSALEHGQPPGPELGLDKVSVINAAAQAADLVARVIGPEALREDSEWAHLIGYMPGMRSGGGSEEILRNTVGDRVLGLPAEPRFDKDVPFRELRTRAAA